LEKFSDMDLGGNFRICEYTPSPGPPERGLLVSSSRLTISQCIAIVM